MNVMLASAENGAQNVVELSRVEKTYQSAGGSFQALRGIDLSIKRGEFVAVVGQSGSGKSTLLNLLAGIDRASAGEVVIAGQSLRGMSESALSSWRGRAVGMVFQFFQLLPTLSALENVMLPMDFCGRWPASERADRALALLEQLGVADQAHKFPGSMSGGQQQRVAVARALANQPPLLLADEPTGNLDSKNAAALLELLGQLSEAGQTVVMVTHEASAQSKADRSLRLIDGLFDVSGEPS